MALGLNKILIAGTYENTPGSYFQAAANIAATTAGNVVPVMWLHGQMCIPLTLAV